MGISRQKCLKTPVNRRVCLSGGPQARNGFTLLEVLVAFTLLALAMGIIMQVFSRGVNGADLADRYAKAAMLAESKLATVGVEEALAEGDYNGQFDDKFAWTMTVRAYASATEPPTPSTLETAALANAQATGAGGTIASTLAPTAPTSTLGNVDIDSLLFVRLYEVELSVAFTTDDGRQRAVTLNTMKIGPRV
jgi:general secretion pathway protein I